MFAHSNWKIFYVLQDKIKSYVGEWNLVLIDKWQKLVVWNMKTNNTLTHNHLKLEKYS